MTYNQFAVRYRGREWSGIRYTRAAWRILSPDELEADLQRQPPRLTLFSIVNAAILEGLKLGYYKKRPGRVVVALHNGRSDLPGLADFARFKTRFDSVQHCYVTLTEPYKCGATVGGNRFDVEVCVVDTQLLSPPGKKKLDDLGKSYRYPKIEIGKAPDGRPYIENMNLLLRDNPDLFERYALRDAEITVKHTYEYWKSLTEEFGLDQPRPPTTIGSSSLKFFKKKCSDLGVDMGDLLGYRIVQKRKWKLIGTDKWRVAMTAKKKIYHPLYKQYMELARLALHGGRNEAYTYGPTPESAGTVDSPPFVEFDLSGAYGVAQSAIQIPDWSAMNCRPDLTDFQAGVLGIAYVQFTFPSDTRFPSLAVEASDGRGLIFPLSGTAYVTASEISVAVRQGAEVEIINGLIIPWSKGKILPFMETNRDLMTRRKQYEPNTFNNELCKTLSNSLYGKTLQGTTDKKAFDTRLGVSKRIPESDISNPYLGGFIAGIIRAVMGEILASIPAHRMVVSVTTDSIITNARKDEIDLTGPMCTFMSTVKNQLKGDPNLLEIKSETSQLVPLGDGVSDDPVILEAKSETLQLLPWRTRGITTIKPQGPKAKLAQGGVQAPKGVPYEKLGDWFVRTMLTRQPGDKWTCWRPMDFPAAHRKNADYVHRPIEITLNFEPDHKRELVGPIMRAVRVPGDDRTVEHLALDQSRPWNTVEEFDAVRDQFEKWRWSRKGGDQLKTLADWRRWIAFQQGAAASAAGVRRSTEKGIVDQARRAVIRAFARKEWGLGVGTFQEAADQLTRAGYPTLPDDFKNARRRSRGRPTSENLIPRDGDGVDEFVRAVDKIWHGFEWWRLLAKPTPKLTVAAAKKAVEND